MITGSTYDGREYPQWGVLLIVRSTHDNEEYPP
jgi:hypothetical protein